MRRLRTVTAARPTDAGTRDGIAYSLWLPNVEPVRGGVVILHGAGSCKESHHDYARRLIAAGLAAIAFDQRGHGASIGPMDARALEDVATIAEVLRTAIGADAPIGIRGSSMGGYLAIVSAPVLGARAVVAICPASDEQLRRGLAAGELELDADVEALDGLLAAHDLQAAVTALGAPLLLLHAEGDERVPVQQSRELAQYARHPDSRLIAVPGGHHRSVQHDDELQAISTRFIERAFSATWQRFSGPFPPHGQNP